MKLEDIKRLEDQLWKAANDFRANTGLKVITPTIRHLSNRIKLRGLVSALA